MKEPVNDNIYPVGTRIVAKADPSWPLVIHKYYERIYYCAVVDAPDQKHLAYFERELIPPISAPEKTAIA